jgi:YegS/Rv2252/BmrU family lipid kinase
MPSSRIAVIMNPAARSARAAQMVAKFRALEPSPDLHLTHSVGHATELAQQLAQEGAKTIVAAGGDGTVNEVLQGICRFNESCADPAQHVTLGTMPAGTMNVFAYELGFQSHLDLSRPWSVIQSGVSHEIDLWMANSRYFLQLAGVGLDAEIVRLTTWEQKRRFGPLSYVMSAISLLQRPVPVISVQCEGRPEMHGSMLLIGNGGHYGGPFKIFPHASLTDGKLDLILFREKNINAWHAMQMLQGMLVDGYRDTADIDYFQVDTFSVSCAEGTALELDGELAGATPVSFRKAPFRLRVAAPLSAQTLQDPVELAGAPLVHGFGA